jgi:uncharacterized membrane protein
MQFASPPPWWLAVLVAAGIAAVAFYSYRRPLVPLSRAQRAALIALRVLALTALAVFLSRPIVLLPPTASGDIVVPILVDSSRSMRVADADGEPRIARAAGILARQLLPGISAQAKADVFSVGDAAVAADPQKLTADARRTDLSGALAAIRDRYRGRRVPGIVLLSDGADTGQPGRAAAASNAASGFSRGSGAQGPPIFTIGIGSAEGLKDREVLGIDAADPRLDQASIDLRVSAISYGYGREPFQLRVLANGRLLDSRRIVPNADGSPLDQVFTVSPDPLNPTVYTAEITADPNEPITENNSRSVLVNPAGRKRRILALEGAPGYDHSFLSRALTQDPGLELDSVIRKGRNDEGDPTFIVQAAGGRARTLTLGFPATKEAFYGYDALLIANVEGDFFTRAQLTTAAEFVSERGGGLLVMGGRSFAQRGLIGTPLEEVLPVELNDRGTGLGRAAFGEDIPAVHNAAVVTPEGLNHPIMRLGATPDESRKLWTALPTLAASAPLGGPRPGASILAVTAAPSGVVLPLVAVQRYGRGRSMIFAGEASWRWRMLRPSTDRSYDFFWRQAVRWLASSAPDPVSASVPETAEPGDPVEIAVDARDRTFNAVADAAVDATLTPPGGEPKPVALRPSAGTAGRVTGAFTPAEAGLYRVHAEARRGQEALGAADRWFYVGGADREFADPRLNEGFLRRIARETGGQYLRAAEAAKVVSLLQQAVPQNLEPERRDLWHEPWAFAIMIVLLSSEWVLRRRWGLR